MKIAIVALVIASALVGLYQLQKKRQRSGLASIAVACLAIATHGSMNGSQGVKDTTVTFVFGAVGALLIIALLLLYLRGK